jgi:hypothetical protein
MMYAHVGRRCGRHRCKGSYGWQLPSDTFCSKQGCVTFCRGRRLGLQEFITIDYPWALYARHMYPSLFATL